MKLFYAIAFRVQVCVAYLRWDILINFILIVFSIVAISYLQLTLRPQKLEIFSLLSNLSSINNQPKKILESSGNERNLLKFYDQLGDHGHAEQQINTLHAIAENYGLKIKKAQYKYTFSTEGQYYVYQIVFPIKGLYPDIRMFVEDFLSTLPFSSLDQIKFKRNNSSDESVDATIQFSLFLKENKKIENE
jgi:hypothetical protein